MILIDNFIDGDLLKNLNNKKIYEENNDLYSWYDKGLPTNPIEHFIKYAASWLNIWDKHEGFEYWTTLGSSSPWHIDKDEQYPKDIPQNSTIFYGYPHTLWGGMLEFGLEETLSEVERFAPTYNRLIFNPEPNRLHRVTQTWAGERMSLVFSGWNEKPKLFKKVNKIHQKELNLEIRNNG